jgi:hypothetical protein
MPQAGLQGEAACQRKDGVSAQGWYAAPNCNAQDSASRPLVSVRHAFLSGDKPDAVQWEGLDPLFCGSSNPDWSLGQLASALFGNTRLDSVAVSLTLHERNLRQRTYLDFAAGQAKARSPFPRPASPFRWAAPFRAGLRPRRSMPSGGTRSASESMWTPRPRPEPVAGNSGRARAAPRGTGGFPVCSSAPRFPGLPIPETFRDSPPPCQAAELRL